MNEINNTFSWFGTSYEVIFNNKSYLVRVENNDYNNFEIEVFDEESGEVIEDFTDEREAVINFLEEENII